MSCNSLTKYDRGYVCDSFMPLNKQFEKYTPPLPVQQNARQGVEAYSKTVNEPVRANEEVMLLASDLANGTPVDFEKVKFISDYLTAHYNIEDSVNWAAHGPEWQEWMGLGARAGLSWSKRCLRKQLEKRDNEMSKHEAKVSLTASIAKVDDEQHLVFGWASVATENGIPVIDRQGDTITDSEMEKGAYDFVLNARVAGEMHQKEVRVGKLVESIVFTKEKQQALGIDLGKTGWWVGFKVDSDAVWKSIKSGKYAAFSIHGRGLREEVTL